MDGIIVEYVAIEEENPVDNICKECLHDVSKYDSKNGITI